MPQSFFQCYAHLVFSTKNREPSLDAQIRPRVHAYLATIARDGGCPFVRVGGVADHVHMIIDLGKKSAPVDLITQIKKESSKFVKTIADASKTFYWQSGYGMFSVSPTHVERVVAYIACQEEHHRNMTFQVEIKGFLERYRIAYNEAYMWD